jgi:hypothetical protein
MRIERRQRDDILPQESVTERSRYGLESTWKLDWGFGCRPWPGKSA